ncbi:hypothetical protein [Nonomuraea guangzhouensis]|uniref:Carbon monoxide dehydrogenase subunit G n=1 Tax=Nonomuraea guangzhouensis TaxID=1291555 RepID=A0ABW4GP23_9ACTN|nr:hypothetical protein [Nonomuraea guangzhouensis]
MAGETGKKAGARLQGWGADTHGSGDAEAEVTLTVAEPAGGAVLRMRTDLLIRGKIVQFGKGAITAVSDKLLRQFAGNLAALIEADRSGAPTAAAAVVTAKELDGLSMLRPQGVARYVPIAAAFAIGLFQGWLLGKVSAQAKLIKELRRG